MKCLSLLISGLLYLTQLTMAMDQENLYLLNIRTETKMKISFGDKEYSLLIGYQKDEAQRLAFNALAEKTFGLSFEEWYQAGYWNEKYIPYTLFDGEKAVANVSVNVMKFNTFGTFQHYIQLGTIMTDASYRNQKLSKFLMDYVLNEWQEKCSFVYLFANHAVLDMYPKYGFERVKEYAYFKSLDKPPVRANNHTKLDMSLKVNREMVHNYATNSTIFGPLAMQDTADLVMFYCLSPLKDSVYYIESLDAIVIAQLNGNLLHLWDVFSKVEEDLDKIIGILVTPDIDQVLLGFTPKDSGAYELKELSGDDYLFVQKNKTELFEKYKVMFPLLSHA